MMDNNSPLTERIRDWYEHSPKAQRAYQRLSADLDTVAARVESATSSLRERITPMIDPTSDAPASDHDDLASDPVSPEMATESSVPPGVKTEREPVDPTS